VILIASIWPETYCYTLSHALASGRPVAGFDIGAVGTRLRDAGLAGRQIGARATVLPLKLARDPAALLDRVVGMAEIAYPTLRPMQRPSLRLLAVVAEE
jgi:hypothetical protein